METFENIQNEIVKKKLELDSLYYQFNAIGNAKYNFLVGKYYSLAATSKINVISIAGFDERYKSVDVNCIIITGGPYYDGGIEVYMHDIISIKLSDIDDGTIREITQQEFEAFLIEALEITKNTIIKDACDSLE